MQKQTNRNGRDAVVVIGAGIVGVCTAWHLLRRGANVLLIDRDEPGLGCSYGNAGAVSFGAARSLPPEYRLGPVPLGPYAGGGRATTLISPEIFEPIRRQLTVANRVLVAETFRHHLRLIAPSPNRSASGLARCSASQMSLDERNTALICDATPR